MPAIHLQKDIIQGNCGIFAHVQRLALHMCQLCVPSRWLWLNHYQGHLGGELFFWLHVYAWWVTWVSPVAAMASDMPVVVATYFPSTHSINANCNLSEMKSI